MLASWSIVSDSGLPLSADTFLILAIDDGDMITVIIMIMTKMIMVMTMMTGHLSQVCKSSNLNAIGHPPQNIP